MFPTLALEVLASVRVVTWFALFESHGYPAGLARRDAESMSALDVAAALLAEGARLPVALSRALVTIMAFSTEDARRDVYGAAAALEHPHRWPEATSPADLIAHLLAQAARDPAVRMLVDAASVLRDRAFRPRSTLLYVGVARRGAPRAAGVAAALEKALATWCASRDFGRVVRVVERGEHGEREALAWELVHEDRTCTDVTLSGARRVAPFAVVSHRRVRSHVVTYEHAHRRLVLRTDCLEAATPLARIFGEVLFADARHFLDEPAVELWKLQELGPASLHVPALASKVTMTAIGGTWHSGKSHAITPRGRDLFKALARYKIRIEGGRLDLVTLRGKVQATDGPARCDVALRPPHLCTVSEPELEPLAHDFLDRAKITSPEPRPRDFFVKQPWIDSAAGWAADVGADAFSSLVKSGVLEPRPDNRAVTPPEHPHAGPTATAYPLHGTKYLAWSPDATVEPFVIEEADLARYALRFGKLAQVIAGELGLEGAAAKLDEDGVLSCGWRALGPARVHVHLATRPIRASTVERLRDAAGHGHAVLVLPEARMQTGGLRQVAMPKLAGPWQPLLTEIVRVLKLEDAVDATVFAPPAARFVVQRAAQRVWLDGVACRVTELHVRLLEILIRHQGKLVHTKDIADYVARGRGHEDTTRRQIESLLAAIAKSFAVAKRKPPKDLRELIQMPKHGQYVLVAPGFVI